VVSVDTSFDTPEECALEESCSKCAHAITESGDLKLAASNLGERGLPDFLIRMMFTESDDDDKGKRKGKRKDRD